MMRLLFTFALFNLFFIENTIAQFSWEKVDSLFQPLPPNVNVYRGSGTIGGRPNIAYYVIADLNDRSLDYTVDTSHQRRLTPSQFYIKNELPLVVVNTTFFSFATNKNLNIVLKDGKLLASNIHTIAGAGKDTLNYFHPLGSAIGISKKRKADVAWVYTDTVSGKIYQLKSTPALIKNHSPLFPLDSAKYYSVSKPGSKEKQIFKKWKMQAAVGGGPVLIQQGEIKIFNNEERKFQGKALLDRHPRTLMGYTKDNKIVIMVVEGRNPGLAEGVSLPEAAELMRDAGCVEALNLDGGGSSCMLINGKPTIKVSDKTGERPVPAVFLIKQ